MAQFVQVNGDYGIKTNAGGEILLDTGPQIGNIRVTGNLIVEGDTLTVEAENLNVNDNTIVLNFGETGAGVSLRYAGIQIDRGTLDPVSISYDENDDTFIFAQGSGDSGAFNYSSSAIRTRYIRTDADTDDGDLTLIGTGSGVVKVSGTLNYEQQISDDDDIPNKKYVDDSIRDNPTFQIIDDNTRVIISDKEVSGSLQYLIDNTGYSTLGESAVSVLVDNNLVSQFYSNRALIQDIQFIGTEIATNELTNANIILRTEGTGKVQTNYGIELENNGVTPAYVVDSNIIYHNTVSTGKTGLYFTNSVDTGELISKNRALLFSMLF